MCPQRKRDMRLWILEKSYTLKEWETGDGERDGMLSLRAFCDKFAALATEGEIIFKVKYLTHSQSIDVVVRYCI